MSNEKNRIERVFWRCKRVFCRPQSTGKGDKFLLDTLREDEFKLSSDLIYQIVDTLETTEDCFRFCSGIECILVLCSELEK